MGLFTPQKVGGHFVFRVRTERCGQCEKQMICKPESSNRTFPDYYKDNLEAQAKRAWLVINSANEFNGRFICECCVKSGSVNFTCELCHETKKTNEIEESFGASEHHLCKKCYETVPAKYWDEKVEELNDDHKWD